MFCKFIRSYEWCMNWCTVHSSTCGRNCSRSGGSRNRHRVTYTNFNVWSLPKISSLHKMSTWKWNEKYWVFKARKKYFALRPFRTTYFFVLVHAVQDFPRDELLQMRYRRLRTAPNEFPLERNQIVANTLQTHIHLFVLPMEIRLDMCVVQLIEWFVFAVLRQVLRIWQVSAPVELALAIEFVCKKKNINQN